MILYLFSFLDSIAGYVVSANLCLHWPLSCDLRVCGRSEVERSGTASPFTFRFAGNSARSGFGLNCSHYDSMAASLVAAQPQLLADQGFQFDVESIQYLVIFEGADLFSAFFQIDVTGTAP